MSVNKSNHQLVMQLIRFVSTSILITFPVLLFHQNQAEANRVCMDENCNHETLIAGRGGKGKSDRNSDRDNNRDRDNDRGNDSDSDNSDNDRSNGDNDNDRSDRTSQDAFEGGYSLDDRDNGSNATNPSNGTRINERLWEDNEDNDDDEITPRSGSTP